MLIIPSYFTKISEIHKVFPAIFVLSDEKSGYASCTPLLCGAALKPLFNADLIEDVSDKRARDNSLYLTEYGNEVCAQAEKLWEKAQQVFEDKVGSENVKLLEEILLSLQTL